MDLNYSKNLEIEVNIKKGLIISNDKEEKKTEDEEEEFWDYEDGGQTMEELERLEKLEILYPTLISVYRRFKNIYISKLLNRWRNMPYDIKMERKEDLSNIKYDTNFKEVKDIQDKSDELYIDNIIPNNPIIKDVEYPLIFQDEKFDDEANIINKKPKKKYEKINLTNDLVLSENNICNYSSDFSCKNDKFNIYKNLIPNLISLEQDLSPIKIKRKAKVIEIGQLNKENIYKQVKPNNPIKREIEKNYIKSLKKDEIKDDIDYIKNKLEEKINENLRKKIVDKFNIKENINDIKDIEINKDYCSEISNKKDKKLEEKLNILNVDYQLNIPTKINLINKLRAKNPKIKMDKFKDIKIRDWLKQKSKNNYKVIDIPSELNDEIIFEQIVPNNPIIKNGNTPLIFIDSLNDNSDAINKKPKKILDKINATDKLNISNNLDIINTDYDYKINIKQRKNIPNIINKVDINLPLIKIKKKRIININDDIINGNIITLGNKEMLFSQIKQNNIKKRNIIPISIKADELNNIGDIKNLKIKNEKINMNDIISLKNIEIKEENNKLYEYKKSFNNLDLIPAIITKNESLSLKPLEIDIFNYKDKLLVKENPKEIKDNINIEKNYMILEYHYKKENKDDKLSLINNNYLLSKINIDKIRYNYKNTLENEEISNNKSFILSDETINSTYKNYLNLPKKLSKYHLNQSLEKVKLEDKINLNDKIDIRANNIKLKVEKYILNKDKNKITIPRINVHSLVLNPIEMNLIFKKLSKNEKPKEFKVYDIKTDYIKEKYSNIKDLKNLQIIKNDYQIFLSKYFKKPKENNNHIENESIIQNRIILPEEESLNKLDYPNKILNIPKINKLSLIQKPEKLKIHKIINIPIISEEIKIEQLKLSNPLKRINLENVNVIKDDKFEDINTLKKKYNKIPNKIFINEDIPISDDMKIRNNQYEINRKDNNLNNLIPKISLNKQIELEPIQVTLKLKLEKYNSLDKPKENKHLAIINNYINRKYNKQSHVKSNDLYLLNNDYYLSIINTKKLSQNYLNTIENKNIINNDNILPEEENISKSEYSNKLLKKPEINKLSLIQKPEKIKIPQIINIPDKSEEINIEQLKLNKPYQRLKEENINISKDDKFEDLENMKKNIKKISNKININENLLISDNIVTKSQQYEINSKNKKKDNLFPKILFQTAYQLQPIKINLKLKIEKRNLVEKPKESRNLEIRNDYKIVKYNPKTINRNDKLLLLNNNYQLTEINKDIFRPNYKNIIGNNNIVKNNNILPEEEKISKLDFYNKLLGVPKLSKLSLIQRPEKIKIPQIINIPDKSEEINIEQLKLNKPYQRLKEENINISKDDKFEDFDYNKNKLKKLVNKININDKIPLSNEIEIINSGYKTDDKIKNRNNLVPKISFNSYTMQKPIQLSLKLKLEKINLLETPKEIRNLSSINEYINVRYNNQRINKKDNLKLINNNYQLSKINAENIRQNYKNKIDNENITENNIILPDEESIKEIKNQNKLLNLPNLSKLSLIQKPEKIKIPQIINIPNISEEKNIEQLKLNNPNKKLRIENINISTDKKLLDLENIKKEHKKINNKINICDKLSISDNDKMENVQYQLSDNKKINLMSKIIVEEKPVLNLIPIPLKLTIEKHNLLENPKENNYIQIKNDYLNIQYNCQNEKDINLSLLNTNYQLSKINTIKTGTNYTNIIESENIINNNNINQFLKAEEKIKETHSLIEFSKPKNIKLNIIQKPEKIQISKIIELPNKVEEINIEQIKPNGILIRELNKENIINDKIYEDLDDIKKVHKKQLNKLEIKDIIPLSDDEIQIQNTNYEFTNSKNKGKDLIPNILHHKPEINPIKLSMKLKLEKYKSLEKPKEIKDIKIKSDYLCKKIENKNYQKTDKLSILDNNYQLSEINQTEKHQNNMLRGRKPLSKESYINIIENENITLNNNFPEDTIKNISNKDQLQFNLCPLIKKSLNQKLEKIGKLINVENDEQKMIEEKLNMNNAIKRDINEIDIKNDELNNDVNILKKNMPKKKLIKENLTDHINLTESIKLQNPDFNLKQTKKNQNIINNEYTELNQIKEISPLKTIKNEKDILNKNLLDDFEKDEEKMPNPNSTEFKFYDSKNRLLSKFNFSSFNQINTNSIEQKQFFNFMNKKFLAFKLFKMKNAKDPRKKWFNIWNKKTKE